MRRLHPTKRLAGIAIASAVALVLLPATAAAPTDQYETFNRGDTTITDARTQLVWQRYLDADGGAPFIASSQGAALAYCHSTYKEDKAQWRLPTMKELLTIVDEVPHLEFEGTANVEKMIDVHAFPRTPITVPFWTSSQSAAKGTDGWTVQFDDGMNGTQAQAQAGYVRCVRSRP